MQDMYDMKAQMLVYLIQYILLVLTLVWFTEFSKGVIKLLPGVWTLSFVCEQKEQVRADRPGGVQEVVLLALSEVSLTAMFEL